MEKHLLLQGRQRAHCTDQHNRLYVEWNLNLSLEPQAKTRPQTSNPPPPT